MNRIDRLEAILIQLKTRSFVRGQDLAERFEVSLRTIYRDMLALAEAGVPIKAEAGVGYAIERGYFLPPIALTREETAALVTAGKLLGDTGLGASYARALDKIRAVLGPGERDFAESLDKRTVSMDEGALASAGPLESLQVAAAEGRVASILYLTAGRAEPERREVEPLGLMLSGASRRMVGYCRLRKGFRAFALDRILECEVLDERFDPSAYAEPGALDWKRFPESEFSRVVLLFEAGAEYRQLENPGLFGFRLERKTSEGIRLEFVLDSAAYLAPWLLEYGSKVRVLEPRDLREEMRRRAEELAAHYSEGC